MKFDSPDFRQMVALARAIFIGLLFITSGIGIYSLGGDILQAWRQDPLRFDSQPWATRNTSGDPTTSFRPGEPVFVSADFTVGTPGLLHNEILLVSLDEPRTRRLSPTESPIQPGHYQTNARAAIVPTDVAPGRYQLQGISSLDGKIRDFTARWETEPFDVAP